MKESPILFSAPMVRALLAGTKTQTRRVVKSIPWLPYSNPVFSQARPFVNAGEWRIAGSEELTRGFRCPYGQPGDRLWVRESILMPRAITEQLLRDGADTWPRCIYRADGSWHGRSDPMLSEADAKWECGDWTARGWRGRPSIHMPRWACRLELEITDVRVQRLHEITSDDAFAEGIDSEGEVFDEGESLQSAGSPVAPERYAFATLWRSINGDASWDENPWVWALTFKRVDP